MQAYRITFLSHRLGVAAPGDWFPGHFSMPNSEYVCSAPGNSNLQYCDLWLQVVYLPDHVGSSEWSHYFLPCKYTSINDMVCLSEEITWDNYSPFLVRFSGEKHTVTDFNLLYVINTPQLESFIWCYFMKSYISCISTIMTSHRIKMNWKLHYLFLAHQAKDK